MIGGGTGLTYQPNPNYCNSQAGGSPDTFTYTLNGGSTATVSVTVTCVDDPPTAVNDSATVLEDAAATAVTVLADDTARWWSEVDRLGHPADERDGRDHRRRHGPDVPAESELLQQPSRRLAGHVHVHAQRRLDGHGVGDGHVLAGRSGGGQLGRQHELHGERAGDGGRLGCYAMYPDPGATITGATVRITVGYAGAEDILALASPGSHPAITPSVSADTLTLTGNASPAAYQAALRDVTYRNSSENPSTAARTLTFTVTDETARTGSDTKGLTVVAVDDPPVAVNDSATVLEDAAATAVPVLTNDTDVDAGPKTIGSASDPANGTVVVTGGGTGLTYQPDPNYCNNPPGTTLDTFTYTLNGGSTATVSVTVTCVNDAPTAGADSFDTIGNTELRVDLAAATTPAVTEATGPANGVRGNDADPVEGDPITVTSIVGCADTTAPYDCTVAGGTVSMNANGDFAYVPSTTLATGTPTDATFQYVVTDQPVVGTPATATGTVTIHVYDKVWYVRQGASGTGTSAGRSGPSRASTQVTAATSTRRATTSSSTTPAR